MKATLPSTLMGRAAPTRALVFTILVTETLLSGGPARAQERDRLDRRPCTRCEPDTLRQRGHCAAQVAQPETENARTQRPPAGAIPQPMPLPSPREFPERHGPAGDC